MQVSAKGIYVMLGTCLEPKSNFINKGTENKIWCFCHKLNHSGQGQMIVKVISTYSNTQFIAMPLDSSGTDIEGEV